MSRLKHHLWEIGKTTLIVAVIELLIVVIASPISANVYLGGYSTNSPWLDTDHVIMDCRVRPGAPILPGNFLGGVLSVAGVEDGSLSGWVYQIGAARNANDDLLWLAQSWDMDSPRDSYEDALPDAESWLAIYLRMDMVGTTTYRNRCWAYENDYDHLTYYDIVYLDMNSGEDSFRVGTYSRFFTTYKHFQFAVESVSRITGYTWYCYEYRVGYYYDGGWRYQPAKVVHGPDSWITRRGWGRVRLGGANYDGVNRGFASRGNVIWKYTGTTVPSGTWLWTTKGSLQTFPPAPFAI